MGETLLAVADLLPDGDRAVQCFYYGDGFPVGFCARNTETGMMIDALVVPLTLPKPDAKGQKDKDAKEASPQGEPNSDGQGKTAGAESEANSSPPQEPTAEAPDGQDAKPDSPPANGRKSKKSKTQG